MVSADVDTLATVGDVEYRAESLHFRVTVKLRSDRSPGNQEAGGSDRHCLNL